MTIVNRIKKYLLGECKRFINDSFSKEVFIIVNKLITKIKKWVNKWINKENKENSKND